MDSQTKTYRLFDIFPDLARDYAKRLHRKKEDIEYTQKFYASEKAENVEPERAVVSYITTASVDRDNEVLLPKGMRSERYEKSGKPVFWGHRYDEPRDIVGQCQWLKPDASGSGIIAKTAFRNNEYADEVYRLYTEDLTGQGPILRGFSVGFIPLAWEEGKKTSDPRRTYTDWELLEFSCVSIPCNPDAQTILAQKGIQLCERLKKDLGFCEEEKGIEAEVEDEPIAEPAPEVKAEVAPAAVPGAVPEVKDAEPDAPVAPPDYLEILARLDDLTRKIDALATPPAPAPSPAPAPEDIIDIDREDEIDIDSGPDIDIDSISAPPAPKLSAQPPAGGVKSIPAETIEEAISRAVNRLNLNAIVAEAVDLSIARLRGKVK